jgi:carotenoid 1,2-hydratase
MYLYSDPSDDIRHDKSEAGAYEWWYFDALDPVSGHGIVIIFYDGLLFSPDYHEAVRRGVNDTSHQHPGFSLSIYDKGATTFYSLASYHPNQVQFGGATNPATIGLNSISLSDSNNSLIYTVTIDETLPSGLRAVGTLQFESPMPTVFGRSGDVASIHQWNLVQPRARVTGEVALSKNGMMLDKFTFNTVGYHDHNTGLRQLDRDFDEWYWGRVHIGDETLVWYNMSEGGVGEATAWLFDSRGVDFIKQVDMLPSGGVSTSIFGLKTYQSWSVIIRGIKYTIIVDHFWDNGPFYQRYRVQLLDSELKAVTGVNHGIAEYIKPNRITAGWVRPMIRIRHHQSGGNGNWIQRSASLARLTW